VISSTSSVIRVCRSSRKAQRDGALTILVAQRTREIR